MIWQFGPRLPARSVFGRKGRQCEATDGPQNYSFWHNAEFDKLVDQIDIEVDSGKRLALIRQAEDLMEQDPPLVPIAWEYILDVWYNYVKGHNPKDYFGIYDVVRFDTHRLDKA